MKAHPILFSAPMVRAILAGTKTQTRRVVKPTRGRPIEFLGGGPRGGVDWNNPECWGYEWADGSAFVTLKADPTDPETLQYPCPYGQPGDRLWVRETFFAWGRWETRYSAKKGRDEWHFVDMTLECGKAYEYPATGGQPQPMGGARHRGGTTPTWWKRPAIHMPRTASRITLEITGVRVERLQEISDEDCVREGCGATLTAIGVPTSSNPAETIPRAMFRELWQSINGPESWDANPWVWAIEFKHLKGQQ